MQEESGVRRQLEAEEAPTVRKARNMIDGMQRRKCNLLIQGQSLFHGICAPECGLFRGEVIMFFLRENPT